MTESCVVTVSYFPATLIIEQKTHSRRKTRLVRCQHLKQLDALISCRYLYGLVWSMQVLKSQDGLENVVLRLS